MASILWDQVGKRYYEAGVDRGVLYTTNNTGVAWNGLTSVTETSSGGEPTPYYLDGVKYLNVPGLEDFGGTIEAYTYPDAFAVHDGTAVLNGLQIHQQRRRPFGLSYRTGLGNDVDGINHGYKLHLIYNCLAMPSEGAYSSLSNDPEAMTFSWSFTTTPVSAADTSIKTLPASHISIDTRHAPGGTLLEIENYLYGTKSTTPRLPTLKQLFTWFEDPKFSLKVSTNETTGISTLSEAMLGESTFIGKTEEGVYTEVPQSGLRESSTPGFYTLEA